MALLAIATTVLVTFILILLCLKIMSWLEKRKIDRHACENFSRYFALYTDAETEMRKIYQTANPMTRGALDAHFGHGIHFLRGNHAPSGSGDRSISLRF